MLFKSVGRPGASPAIAHASDEHVGIRTIGRLVLICAAVLIISAMLLVGTALQVMSSIDQADLAAERLRAANALDAMTERYGPLTPDSAELLGRLAGLRDAHLSDSVDTAAGAYQIPLLGGLGPSGSFLTWTQTPVGQEILVKFAPVRLPIIGGMLLIVLGVLLRLRSVVADIERQRKLAHVQSRSDVVTGLANRLAFETALAELAGGDAPFALILFDLNRFKDINDAFGHAAGDEVLRAVGARLSRLLGPKDLLTRIGGDEFALLSTSRHHIAILRMLARDCITAIEAPIQLSGRAVRVGVSLGIVPSTAPHDRPASLVAAADTALYRAKSRQGSAFRFAGEDDALPPQTAHRRSA